MKATIAASPPKEWNQKNLPSDIERFEEKSGSDLLEQLPAALTGVLRRRPKLLMISAAALAAVGLVWFFSSRD